MGQSQHTQVAPPPPPPPPPQQQLQVDVQLANDGMNLALVPYAREFLPLLVISEIGEASPKFAIEGKILNLYGTYKVASDKYSSYLKLDIVDTVYRHYTFSVV
ncbi:hypothetical protein GOP47_0026130 [Adiantum capillus-veneris]|uniref:Uncharacterized protein n=1 Tax=Adiantum capillus-veneris TaxID=13818 RepID=A0A9D4U1C2_ADICA|nr:hypothetical protein GOP47_0026130 [Adiantum capillus-veneris]